MLQEILNQHGRGHGGIPDLGGMQQGGGMHADAESVVKTACDWASVSNQVGGLDVQALKRWHGMTLVERNECVRTNETILANFWSCLSGKCGDEATLYIIVHLYELVRADCSVSEVLWDAWKKYDICGVFLDIMQSAHCGPSPIISGSDPQRARAGMSTSPSTGTHGPSTSSLVSSTSQAKCRVGPTAFTSLLSELSGFVVSNVISKGALEGFPLEKVKGFVSQILEQREHVHMGDSAVLMCLAHLLKIDKHRGIIWDNRESRTLIKDGLNPKKSSTRIYRSVLCIWMLTLNRRFTVELENCKIITELLRTLRTVRVEKVARIGMNIIKNVHNVDECAEAFIETDIGQTLVLLEFEKWRDNEMYDSVRACQRLVAGVLHRFNNFSRYTLEIDKHKLKWSILHSEQFWSENAKCFDADEFLTIRKLIGLLACDDNTTIAIACFDLGEFAQRHPIGKQICNSLKVKPKITALVGHHDREVASQALLCVQKMLLENWQAVAATA